MQEALGASGAATPRGRFTARDLLLYAVTDSAWLGSRSLEACVEEALRGGATCVQLREKDASSEERMQLARALKAVCAAHGVPFLVNDDVECALAVDADGVHVGQDDMAAQDARALLGPHRIVGVSAQTVSQARSAYAAGADYLGVGALIPTATKPDAADVSFEELARICASVPIPVVGIGGLNAHTIPQLAGTRAAGAAVVSAIFAADDVYSQTAQLRRTCERTFL